MKNWHLLALAAALLLVSAIGILLIVVSTKEVEPGTSHPRKIEMDGSTNPAT